MTTATRKPTEATRRPRQTAGNNAFLKAARYWLNDAFYRRCLEFVNGPEGEAGARAYLLETMFRTLPADLEG